MVLLHLGCEWAFHKKRVRLVISPAGSTLHCRRHDTKRHQQRNRPEVIGIVAGRSHQLENLMGVAVAV